MTSYVLACAALLLVMLVCMICHLIGMRMERVERNLRALDKCVEVCVKSAHVPPTAAQIDAANKALAALIARYPHATALVIVGCVVGFALAESRGRK